MCLAESPGPNLPCCKFKLFGNKREAPAQIMNRGASCAAEGSASENMDVIDGLRETWKISLAWP